MGIPFALLVPVLATRLKSITPLIALGLAFYVLGYGGLLIAPAALP